MSDLLVFIPAYNEEECIRGVIEDAQEVFETIDILVIDDGSTDSTRQVSLDSGAKVISFPYNQGSGAASQTGYLYALENGYKFTGQLDADGQHRAKDLKMIIETVRDDETDLAVGSRYLEPEKFTDSNEAYEASFVRKTGISIFRKLLSFATGTRLTDVTSGMRAANEKVIYQFAGLYDPDYAEIESLQRCLNLGLRVKEYQVLMLPRQAGESKIGTWASVSYALKTFLILGIGVLRKGRERKQLNTLAPRGFEKGGDDGK